MKYQMSENFQETSDSSEFISWDYEIFFAFERIFLTFLEKFNHLIKNHVNKTLKI